MVHHSLLQAITTTILVITLLFLSPPTTAASPVLDVEGNPLEAGSQYYVLTSGRGAAGRGGLTHVEKPSQLCPTYVAQHFSWLENGRPVSFIPSNSSHKQITLGNDVRISFGIIALCRTVGIWKVTFDSETNVPYVTTNGGFDTEEALETFKIEETSSGFSYKIVFCFKQGGRECKQVDATEEGPLDLYYLSLVPLKQRLPFFGFVFKKVDTNNATTSAFY